MVISTAPRDTPGGPGEGSNTFQGGATGRYREPASRTAETAPESTTGRYPDALTDPRFQDWAARTANEPALRAIIEEALAADDPRTWEARLTAADVPCGSIWTIDEIVDHPQLEHRDVLQTIDSRYGPMRLVGSGFRLEHGSPSIDREPPLLGEHTDEILREAGYSPEEIERLHRDAVV